MKDDCREVKGREYLEWKGRIQKDVEARKLANRAVNCAHRVERLSRTERWKQDDGRQVGGFSPVKLLTSLSNSVKQCSRGSGGAHSSFISSGRAQSASSFVRRQAAVDAACTVASGRCRVTGLEAVEVPMADS